MQRTVTSSWAFDVTEPATLVLEIAVAQGYLQGGGDGLPCAEDLSIRVAGADLPYRELVTAHGTRLHVVQAPVGQIHIEYSATIDGRSASPRPDEVDLLRYLRLSRYCESDSLSPTAHSEFAGVSGG